MTSRPLCYVAGPYWDENPRVRAWNVARACFLGRLAVLDGLAPIVVHSSIEAMYGFEETMATRAMGLEVDLAILRMVAKGSEAGSGRMWVLLRDNGIPSEGTNLEVREWRSLRFDSFAQSPLVGPWEEWGYRARSHGLAVEWAALAVQP